jgi:hypothetical protein
MKSLLLLFVILSSNNAFANANSLEEFYGLYKKGQYEKAIDSLNKLTIDQNSEASKYYLTGISYARLQEFDKAADNFALAIEKGHDAKDMYYEYGQALYAKNSLKASRDAFKKSAELKFNLSASLYYQGHISQILEDYSNAKKAYLEIIKLKDKDKKIDQVAKFQLAESELQLTRNNITDKEKLSKDVQKRIIPMLKMAYESDRNSAVGLDINKRIKEIMKEFDLDPDIMVNGRRISSDRFHASLDMKTKFDDNITNTNLENDVQQSLKESYIVETEFETKYDYVYKKKWIASPLFRVSFNKYTNQDEADVYKNDSAIMTIALKNKFETTAFDRPSSYIFDFDYSKTIKDYNSSHKLESYSSSVLLTFGKQINYFSFGDTNFKFKYKDFKAYSDSINNHTISFSIDQVVALSNNDLLILLFNADMVDNYNDSNTNTNSYMFRLDYIFPEFMPSYTFTGSLTTILNDTLKLSESRGLEKTITPSLELAKEINQNFKVSANLEYTNNKSKLADYTYHKYVTSFGLNYNF